MKLVYLLSPEAIRWGKQIERGPEPGILGLLDIIIRTAQTLDRYH